MHVPTYCMSALFQSTTSGPIPLTVCKKIEHFLLNVLFDQLEMVFQWLQQEYVQWVQTSHNHWYLLITKHQVCMTNESDYSAEGK